MRSPTYEPERWLVQNQKTKDAARENWKLQDSIGFAAQEARRKLYNEMKQKGKIRKVTVAVPALACQMFLEGPNEEFYDDPYHDPIVSWSSASSSASTFASIRERKRLNILRGYSRARLYSQCR